MKPPAHHISVSPIPPLFPYVASHQLDPLTYSETLHFLLYSAVQFIAVWGSAVQCSVVWRIALNYRAACAVTLQCSVVQSGAVRCSIVQCNEVWCSVVQYIAV